MFVPAFVDAMELLIQIAPDNPSCRISGVLFYGALVKIRDNTILLVEWKD